MRAGLVLISGTVAFLAGGPGMAAVDHDQFCRAMTEIARLGNVDAGRWLDRYTRDDGVEVLCDIRTVNFKRFIRPGPDSKEPGWKQKKSQEWNSTACSSSVLREAIDGGWIITSAITIAGGDRILAIAICK
jgi:hypothetical protein